MSAVAGFLSVLPEQMRDPVLFAIPFFGAMGINEHANVKVRTV